MTTLDKSVYNINVCLPAVKCKAKSCGKFLAVYKDVLLKRPHFRKIIDDPLMGKGFKLILLDPIVNCIDYLHERQQNIILEEGATFCECNYLKITYEDFTFNEIIQSIIPEDSESVTSFETVGHIAHVNLREHLKEYKYVIGEVLLDKNVHIKTVVNKTNIINATFRFFEMELIAGEDRMSTSVSEHGCLFEFDYSQVYWNSRLQSEHKRLVDQIQPGDTVFDVFAGVGPFAIPAARKQCNVFANDLNKMSHDSLLHNAKLNKVASCIKVYNMDGREFLNDIVIEKHIRDKHDSCKVHIVMNLPAIAPEFLDVFKQKYESFGTSAEVVSNIIVHCYCFSKSKTPEIDAERNIANSIGLDILPHVKTHLVRRVAPNKVMLCVTFNLLWFQKNLEELSESDSVLSRKRTSAEDVSDVDTKRPMPIV